MAADSGSVQRRFQKFRAADSAEVFLRMPGCKQIGGNSVLATSFPTGSCRELKTVTYFSSAESGNLHSEDDVCFCLDVIDSMTSLEPDTCPYEQMYDELDSASSKTLTGLDFMFHSSREEDGIHTRVYSVYIVTGHKTSNPILHLKIVRCCGLFVEVTDRDVDLQSAKVTLSCAVLFQGKRSQEYIVEPFEKSLNFRKVRHLQPFIARMLRVQDASDPINELKNFRRTLSVDEFPLVCECIDHGLLKVDAKGKEPTKSRLKSRLMSALPRIWDREIIGSELLERLRFSTKFRKYLTANLREYSKIYIIRSRALNRGILPTSTNGGVHLTGELVVGTSKSSSPGDSSGETTDFNTYKSPIWRIGGVLETVLKTPGDHRRHLSPEHAMDIGRGFRPTEQFAIEYATNFKKICSKMNENGRNGIIRGGISSDNKNIVGRLDKSYSKLELNSIQIRYDAVPIISFPPFLLEIGGREWIVRETITICENDARSKMWLLIQPVLEVDDRFTGEQLNVLRDGIEPFVKYYFEGALKKFYLSVLTTAPKTVIRKQHRADYPIFASIRFYNRIEILGVDGIIYDSNGECIGDTDVIEELDNRGLLDFRKFYSGRENAELDLKQLIDFDSSTVVSIPGRQKWKDLRPEFFSFRKDEGSNIELRAVALRKRRAAIDKSNPDDCPHFSYRIIGGDYSFVSDNGENSMIPGSRVFTASVAKDFGQGF